jgi:hypothetical protein
LMKMKRPTEMWWHFVYPRASPIHVYKAASGNIETFTSQRETTVTLVCGSTQLYKPWVMSTSTDFGVVDGKCSSPVNACMLRSLGSSYGIFLNQSTRKLLVWIKRHCAKAVKLWHGLLIVVTAIDWLFSSLVPWLIKSLRRTSSHEDDIVNSGNTYDYSVCHKSYSYC